MHAQRRPLGAKLHKSNQNTKYHNREKCTIRANILNILKTYKSCQKNKQTKTAKKKKTP